MARPSTGSGLKRQVSPTWAIIIVVGVIGLALLIGLSGPLWRALTAKRVRDSEIARPGEIRGMQDRKRVAGERLGVTLSHLPDRNGGGLPVTGAMPGVADGLQAGDVITRVEGVEVRGPGDMTDILKATFAIPVGQQVRVGVRRAGRTTTVRVPRREATLASGGTPGRGMGLGLRGNARGMPAAR